MVGPVTESPAVRNSLRHAAIRATLAPSVHNTQPWQLRVTGTALEIWADRSRQLQVLDPTGRQLMISCGCALFNARVFLASAGYAAEVERFPDPDDSDLLARLQLAAPVGEPPDIRTLNPMIDTRQTNRRQFADQPVEQAVVNELIAAAAAEGALLFPIVEEQQRVTTAVLSQQADAEQNSNPAYRAELRAWTSDDPNRRDGVPASAVPHVDTGSMDDIPIRDFDTHGTGWLPTETHSSIRQCLLLLLTPDDSPRGWLRAGEALERIWLEATRHGYAASLLTQVIEIPRTRQKLRSELDLTEHPVVLLRIGRAPVTPASRRRRVEDVIVEDLP